MFAFVGDHFVIRDSSEQHTIAGGTVLDPDGDGESQTSRTALNDIDSLLRLTISRLGFTQRANLLSKSRFGTDEIREALKRLQERGEIIQTQHIAVDSKLWRELRAQAIQLIDDAHKKNPERAGIDLSELRSALHIQEPQIIEALVADLCDRDFIRKGSIVARVSYRPTLPPRVQPLEKKIRETLSERPFDPPSRKTIESDARAQQIVRFLIESDEVVEIAPDVVLLRESFERMKSQVAEFVLKNGPATVSDLRKALGSSRRVMVPLLEQFDREGVTRRVGDKRMLCPGQAV
jgi:selenocysteine-specific elongation factor